MACVDLVTVLKCTGYLLSAAQAFQLKTVVSMQLKDGVDSSEWIIELIADHPNCPSCHANKPLVKGFPGFVEDSHDKYCTEYQKFYKTLGIWSPAVSNAYKFSLNFKLDMHWTVLIFHLKIWFVKWLYIHLDIFYIGTKLM